MRKPSSRYTEIAYDIAKMITRGELGEGDRISGRSTLASKYKVSPETIRRAVSQLKDFGIVDSAPKNGIQILSSQKALEYISNYQNQASFQELKNEIHKIIEAKMTLEKELDIKVNKMVEGLTMQRDIGIIYPYEIDIPDNSILIDISVSESSFWHRTGATIIGIKRNGNNYLSPGPNWIFEPKDTIVFVGKKSTYGHVVDYVRQKK